MSSTKSKIAVNGSTNASDVQDQITLALLQNGGVARIQSTLQQRLDEAGWSEHLRDYVTRLFRSGECVTFFEAMEKVKRAVRADGTEAGDGVDEEGAAGLVIPKSATEGGVEVVRKELEAVCQMKK